MNQSQNIYLLLEKKAENPARAHPKQGQDRRLESRLSEDGKYGEIKLTRGKIALVNLEDFEMINKFTWFALPSIKTFYAIKSIRHMNKRYGISMARYISKCPKGLEVDHINGDGLDNRRINLRICTKKQNIWNKKININNKTGYIGVCKRKRNGLFEVYFKHRFISSHQCPIEAAKSYDKICIKENREFAVINFPLDRLAND